MSDESNDSSRQKEVRDDSASYARTMSDPEHSFMLGCLADYHETCSWLRLSADEDLNDPALYWIKAQKNI